MCIHLHVMTEFEIRNKAQSLRHGNKAICFEDHECQRPSWLDVTVYKFGEYIEADLSVRDGLNNSDGQGEGEGNCQGQEEGPPS